MHEGRIEQVGPKLEIYHRPATRFVAGFVGAPNRLHARIAEQNGDHARLAWDGIDLISRRIADGAVGDAVDLFLKPERIQIMAGSGEPGGDGYNRLEGRAARRDLQGTIRGLPGGAPEPARAHGQRAAGDGRPGTRRQRLDRLDAGGRGGVSGRRAVNRTARLLLLSLPGALFVLLFLILPLLSVVVFSFWRTESYVMIPDWNLDNYATILGEGTYLTFLGRSLLMAAVVAVICLVYAWPCAYLIAKHGGRYRLLLVLLTAAPFLTGILLRVTAMQQILGPIGLLNMALQTFGLPPIEALMYTNVASAIGLVYLWIPFMLVAIYLSLLNFDFQLLEVAKVCGARPWQAFWQITWPLNWMGTAIGIVLVVIPTLAATVTPRFLGGPNGALYGNILEHQFGATGTWALGSAMGVVLFAVSLLAIGLVWKTVNLSRAGFTGALE